MPSYPGSSVPPRVAGRRRGRGLIGALAGTALLLGACSALVLLPELAAAKRAAEQVNRRDPAWTRSSSCALP